MSYPPNPPPVVVQKSGSGCLVALGVLAIVVAVLVALFVIGPVVLLWLT